MILLGLIQNITLVVTLSLMERFLVRFLGRDSTVRRIGSGLLFGGVVVLVLLSPVTFAPGLIFDGRSIVLCAAGVIGGPIVAGIAALIGAAFRVYLGGSGVALGLAVIAESAGLGTAFYYLRRRGTRVVPLWQLFVLGVAVHGVMAAMLFAIPSGISAADLWQIIPIVLTVYPVATLLICAFLLDDEQRLLYRDALAESEQQLKLAIEASGTGLWDWRIDTDALVLNARWAEIVGYTLEELGPLTLDTWRRLINPEDLPVAEDLMAQHIRGEIPVYQTEVRLRHRDGSWVWVEARGRVTERDANGTPVRMTGTHIDATARIEAALELKRSYAVLARMVHDVAEAMGRIVEARDPYTQGHQRRVAELSRAIALRMGMPEREADGIEMAGLLHDVGKMAIPAEILTKSGALSEAEYALIKGHPQQGHDMLKGIAFPWPIADAVLQHHERADGSGYPGGLRNAETLVSARIIAVADVLEAMAGERPYRRALGMEAAMAEIRDHPAAYDPEVAAAALSICGSGDFTFAR